MRHHLEIASLLTPLTAFIAIWVAYKQYKTENNQLRLSLYEKRYSVYDGIKNLLIVALKNGRIQMKDISDFIISTKEHDFLFNDDITQHIKNIREKAVRWQCLSNELHIIGGIPNEEKRKKLATENSDLFLWFSNQFDVSKELFKKYLRFDQ